MGTKSPIHRNSPLSRGFTKWSKQDSQALKNKKPSQVILRGFLSFFSGLDGTRTRDPMRDRHVF